MDMGHVRVPGGGAACLDGVRRLNDEDITKSACYHMRTTTGK